MQTNTEILMKMVGDANDNGLDADYQWNIMFPDQVLDAVVIDGKYIPNDDHEHEFELAVEAEDVYDGDRADANRYYNN